MTRRRSLLLVVLSVLALFPGMGVGNGPGGSSGCTPGVSVQVPEASTPGKAVPVATNANVVCPTPEASGPGGIWGPHGSQQQQPHVAGTNCTQEVWEPMELSLTPGGQQQVFWPDPSNPGTGSDTPEPQFISQIIGGISAMDFWTQAGTTTDYYMPFTLNGKWDATGFKCIPKDPNDPQGSFQIICGAAPVPVGCLRQVTHRTGGGPLPITALQGVDIRGQMLQLIHPGTVASLPAQPNPAVVNVPACFFLNGADIGGRDINAPQSFELVLLGPVDGDGRQVFYVFRVDIVLQSVDWDFGDSSVTEGLPPQCVGVSNAPLQFAHRYLRYSPPGGFAISAQETFTLHVTEYWVDANGIPNPPADLGNLPDIVVNPGPVPGIREVVVQEEGVPIG